MVKHEFNIAEQGDELEKRNTDFIFSNIPNYEKIWKVFIGNKGGERPEMALMKNMSGEDEVKRRNFSEWHYTCLESFVLMNKSIQNAYNLEVNMYDDYLNLLNYFFVFQAHSGRIRDNIGNMCEKIFESNSVAKHHSLRLEEFYQRRNEVLHGKKLPFNIVSGLLYIPEIKGKEEESFKWNSHKQWDEINDEELKVANEYMDETIQEMTNIVNSILGAMYDEIMEAIKFKKWEIVVPEIKSSTGISGVCSSTSSASFSGRTNNG